MSHVTGLPHCFDIFLFRPHPSRPLSDCLYEIYLKTPNTDSETLFTRFDYFVCARWHVITCTCIILCYHVYLRAGNHALGLGYSTNTTIGSLLRLLFSLSSAGRAWDGTLHCRRPNTKRCWNIRNYIHYKAWDEITYPFPKFNDVTVDVWE